MILWKKTGMTFCVFSPLPGCGFLVTTRMLFYMFSRESRTKPTKPWLATGILGGEPPPNILHTYWWKPQSNDVSMKTRQNLGPQRAHCVTFGWLTLQKIPLKPNGAMDIRDYLRFVKHISSQHWQISFTHRIESKQAGGGVLVYIVWIDGG